MSTLSELGETDAFLKLVDAELGRLHALFIMVASSEEDRDWAKERIVMIHNNMLVRKIFLPPGCEIV